MNRTALCADSGSGLGERVNCRTTRVGVNEMMLCCHMELVLLAPSGELPKP